MPERAADARFRWIVTIVFLKLAIQNVRISLHPSTNVLLNRKANSEHQRFPPGASTPRRRSPRN